MKPFLVPLLAAVIGLHCVIPAVGANSYGGNTGIPTMFGTSFSEAQTCAANVCTRAAPTSTAEGASLLYVRSAVLRACAASGQTLSGTGTLLAYRCDARLTPQCAHVPELDRGVTLSGERCQEFQGFGFTSMTAAADSYVWAASSVGVSGGAALTVYIIEGN